VDSVGADVDQAKAAMRWGISSSPEKEALSNQHPRVRSSISEEQNFM